ncbi:hypothetical protein ACFVFI_26550 [Streptomyces sp. NPDC057705]|uniref:hypothetical protein n=1 Tax=Streptomyces sp. NPDC057705 TaxID=3346222 RepID=UPI0036C46383
MFRSSRITAATAFLAVLLATSAGAGASPAVADGSGDSGGITEPAFIVVTGDNNHIGVSGRDSHVGSGQVSGTGHTVGSPQSPQDTVDFFVRNDSDYTLHLASITGIAGGVTGPTDLPPRSSPTAFQQFPLPSTVGSSDAVATYDVRRNGTSVGSLKVAMVSAILGAATEMGCNPQNPVVNCPAPTNTTSVNVVNSP